MTKVNRLPRARMRDVARAAGVSVATVDRVFNQRGGVRAKTAQRVWEAVEQLGAGATPRHLRPTATTRLDFLLPAGAGPSIEDNLRHAVDAVATNLGAEARCHFLERINPAALAREIRARAGERSDGVAIHALEHPLVRDAVEEIAADGIPVVSILSDLSSPGRVGFVGIDNRAAGRTAGYLMGRFLRGLQGPVAVLAGSPLYRNHEEREIGFRTVLREEFAALEVLGHALSRDEPEANHEETLRLLDAHPDLLGIYGIGSGNRGVVRALRERDRVRDVTFITHNLTATSRRHILEGAIDAVIHQDMRRVAEAAICMLLARRPGATPEQRIVPFEIVVRESLPA
jgi:LacI family transcriptional regulator